ncbi:hypothetical protein J7L05_07500 [bacterium]|nr:hypothetical protein [bacterium]
MESMIRAVVPIVVVIVAVGLFYVAKSAFGWTLGVRTFWPAFVALFLYSYYVLSLDRETYNNKDNQQ